MTDKPRGFGFITFENSDSAAAAISEGIYIYY
jgi:RNA recognition motif-containing protein